MLNVLFSSLFVLENISPVRSQVIRQETGRSVVETSLVSYLALVGYDENSLFTGDNKLFSVTVAVVVCDNQHWLFP